MKTYHFNPKTRGFTLIEFLVASALAIIVVLAASSTYFITRKLNISAQQRINVQNDLRNAATMIMRDARVAGSFGCFTTGKLIQPAGAAAATSVDFPDITNTTIGRANNAIRLAANSNSGYGVIWTDNVAGINLPGARVSNALIFIYGKGNVGLQSLSGSYDSAEVINANSEEITSTASAQGPMVLSSCQNAYLFTPTGAINNNALAFNGALNGVGSDIKPDNLGTLSISKLNAVAYIVATVNGKNSLLRYELQPNGTWPENPQLLSTKIDNMDVSFAYEGECNPNELLPANSLTFNYSNALNTENLPALAQIRFTVRNTVGEGNSSQASYIVNASVRGGSQCAHKFEIEP